MEHDIYKLKNNIFTKIGEKGARISGGQKQRLIIARALYSNRDVLILDESTNALDEKTEQKIYKNLRKLLKTKTIIVVTHKKSLINNFNYAYKLANYTIKKIKN